MFTGIIETLGKVHKIKEEGGNIHLSIDSDISSELKIDQSVAHNGVCLTVVAIEGSVYTVTAIEETLDKTSIGKLRVGDVVNLERAMIMGSRLDGHIVQGHVDCTGIVTKVAQKDGSWVFGFEYDANMLHATIEKGSITIDGTSLTVIDSGKNHFGVAIIPYTYEHTRFHTYAPGTVVNLEFDVIGKYVAKLMQNQS
ncbi:MAG: riboflavin synthase [Flavobacteriaceae bacterium]|nr:riboflavin synthase [Flavobacteriaceae bacterium]